ncbi:hypothetical protein D3C71_1921540 [compost metagenome]
MHIAALAKEFAQFVGCPGADAGAPVRGDVGCVPGAHQPASKSLTGPVAAQCVLGGMARLAVGKPFHQVRAAVPLG